MDLHRASSAHACSTSYHNACTEPQSFALRGHHAARHCAAHQNRQWARSLVACRSSQASRFRQDFNPSGEGRFALQPSGPSISAAGSLADFARTTQPHGPGSEASALFADASMSPEQLQLAMVPWPMRLATTLVYCAVAICTMRALWTASASLGAAVLVTYATDSLSLRTWAVLLLLAWTDRMVLYWIYFAGTLVDKLFQRIAPPVSRFLRSAFALWVLYVALSPISWNPIP